MKVYVAGKTNDIETVRFVQNMCRTHHHEITHDWTKVVEEVGGAANEHGVSDEDQQRFANADTLGVYVCDLVIACGHSNLAGTFIEIGLGIAWNRPIWLYNWDRARQTVFQKMTNFKIISHYEELNQRLASADPVRIEREPARSIVIPPDARWEESSFE